MYASICNTSIMNLVVFTGEGLRHLIAEVGAGQVVLGADYPFAWNTDLVGHILTTAGLSDAAPAAILAQRWDWIRIA